MELKKILCAVDLKDSVNPAVEYAKMLSELSGASISAIYVVSSRSAYENLQVPVEDIAKGMRSIWSRARGDMDAFVEKQFPGMDVNGLIYEGRPAEKIVEIAKELGVDMIVMGTHAREGLDRLFFGSVANEVVKSAKCPVMTIRPPRSPSRHFKRPGHQERILECPLFFFPAGTRAWNGAAKAAGAPAWA